MWCIGVINGEYLANMEDILDVYEAKAVEKTVRLCFDERPTQLIGEVLAPIRAKPNRTRKEHQEYVRKGVCNVLLAYNIETGQRHIRVTDTKKKSDYTNFMKWLSEEIYPEATKIILVQDNYGTHSYGAFYENLPPEEARKLKGKFEFHFTPKHGSWLNMAEMEFSALARQCLDRRIPDKKTLLKEVLIWGQKRNQLSVKVNWSFTTDKARIKLKSRYEEVSINTQN